MRLKESCREGGSGSKRMKEEVGGVKALWGKMEEE